MILIQITNEDLGLRSDLRSWSSPDEDFAGSSRNVVVFSTTRIVRQSDKYILKLFILISTMDNIFYFIQFILYARSRICAVTDQVNFCMFFFIQSFLGNSFGLEINFKCIWDSRNCPYNQAYLLPKRLTLKRAWGDSANSSPPSFFLRF